MLRRPWLYRCKRCRKLADGLPTVCEFCGAASWTTERYSQVKDEWIEQAYDQGFDTAQE